MRRFLLPCVIAMALMLAGKKATAEPMTTTECGCGGSLGLSAGLGATATSFSDCSTTLPVSLTTVLGANPDVPEYAYGEDPLNGWVAMSATPMEFKYLVLGEQDPGFPESTNVLIDGVPVATIQFPTWYLGTSMAVVDQGTVYCGTISLENIDLTVAVPEPSFGWPLMLSMSFLAVSCRGAMTTRGGRRHFLKA